MTGTLRPVRRDAEGPSDTFAAQVRDSLAVRLRAYDQSLPGVLDLLAEVHVALHDELHGHAAALCGPSYSPRCWRHVLCGERDLSVKDFLRLLLSPHPRARAAAGRVLSIVDGAARRSAIVVEAHEALAGWTVTNATLAAEALRDLADGRLDAREATDLEPEIAAAEASLARLKAAAAAAKVRS